MYVYVCLCLNFLMKRNVAGVILIILVIESQKYFTRQSEYDSITEFSKLNFHKIHN